MAYITDSGLLTGGNMTSTIYEKLDPCIRDAVRILAEAGIETFESCQGGESHALPEPTIRFHGEHGEGFRALGIAFAHLNPGN